jgi:hypothetical protein
LKQSHNLNLNLNIQGILLEKELHHKTPFRPIITIIK